MDLGTGVFLSSVLLAIVLLYGFTKDRWRWRKIIGRTALFALLLIAGSAAIIAIVQYWDEIFPAQLQQQTQYAGLKLGMSPQEVMYIKGYPAEVLEEVADPAWKGILKNTKTKELKEGKKIADYQHWAYDEYKLYLKVEFNSERTKVVGIRCYSEDKFGRCPAVGSVRDGVSEKDALRKLGGPAEQRIDDATKSIRFPGLGVKLWLTQEQVYMLEIYDPKLKR